MAWSSSLRSTRIVRGVYMLQCKVRALLKARSDLWRKDIKLCWEHTSSARTVLLGLTYTLVLLYIAFCVYTLLLFGAPPACRHQLHGAVGSARLKRPCVRVCVCACVQ